MSTVSAMIATKQVTRTQLGQISRFSEGIRLLVQNDDRVRSDDAGVVHLSDTLVALLSASVDVAQAALRGEKGRCESRPWPKESPKIGSDGDLSSIRESYEDVVRSASWFPSNPVFRTLPWSKHDRANELAASRRKGKKSDAAEAAVTFLQGEQVKKGFACNKYKEKNSKLTPGLYTVFCLGCSVCIGFELMDDPESPATPFRIFAQRAFTDFKIRERWLRHAVWEDTLTSLPPFMQGR
mmetsp:Transcript_17898/g.43846  ORF Transcript_17898/g.43846 Transcript_17898/m.43846 type:complete len:239 (-) Transcript_17898:61-777(-)